MNSTNKSYQNMDAPFLSVITITYNHEHFIAKTIEGVLMQKTSFPIEFIIAEDCSTDNTRAICQQYAAKYPDLIKLLISETNVGAIANERRVMHAAKGKYVAFCEGDDYWTDPHKLQKQVDFLEENPEYSVTFHRFKNIDVSTGETIEDGCGYLFEREIDGIDVNMEMFFAKWITQPLTMVYRRNSFDLSFIDKYKHYRDMHTIFHLLKAGKCYLFGFDGGIRLIHSGGIHSQIALEDFCDMAVVTDKEFYEANKKDYFVKKSYADILQNCIYDYAGKLGKKKTPIILSWRLFILTKNLKKLLRNIRFIIKSNKRK